MGINNSGNGLTIQHKSGKQNQNANALSRNPVDSTVSAVAAERETELLEEEALCSFQKEDPD